VNRRAIFRRRLTHLSNFGRSELRCLCSTQLGSRHKAPTQSGRPRALASTTATSCATVRCPLSGRCPIGQTLRYFPSPQWRAGYPNSQMRQVRSLFRRRNTLFDRAGNSAEFAWFSRGLAGSAGPLAAHVHMYSLYFP
jgi:hypothetical protein